MKKLILIVVTVIAAAGVTATAHAATITGNSLVKQAGSHALCGSTLAIAGALTLTRP